MSLDAVIIDPASQEPLVVKQTPWGKMLLSMGPECCAGHFKSVTHTTNTTTTMTSPVGQGSLLLTDLIIAAEKITGGVATVRFYDGTHAVNIFSALCTDAPLNIAMSFKGRFQGWKGAYMQVISSASNMDATYTLGYMLIPEEFSLSYASWNAERR